MISAVGSTPALFPILLACRARNQPLLALDHDATDGEIDELAATFGAVAVFTSAHRSMRRDDAVTVDEGCALILLARAPGQIDCRGAAILKLTSGSTGAPRATLTRESALVERRTAPGGGDGHPGGRRAGCGYSAGTFGTGSAIW